ncbi:carboxymuconolactone decarboxylase family protein [Gymnodinialimonas sp.]
MSERLNYIAINGPAIASMFKAKSDVTKIEHKLKALVEVRVSQINGCAYCVDVHTMDARSAGETQQRLDCLPVWREAQFFDARERAALAWAEAVTQVATQGAPQPLYDALFDHFSDAEVVDLTLVIAQMNAWNRLAVSFAAKPKPRD